MGRTSGVIAGTSARSRARQARFIVTLARTASVSAAADSIDRPVAICYQWRAQDAEFAAQWDAALKIGYDRLEAALLAYALERIERAGAAAVADVPGEDGTPAPVERAIGSADLLLAVRIVARQRGLVEGKKPAKRATLPTRAETDAVLTRALDGLAKQARLA